MNLKDKDEETTKSERKYQIFISSTFKDLADYRKEATRIIIEYQQIPIALENFSPSNKTDLEVIDETIKNCQAYILILAGEYGSRISQNQYKWLKEKYPNLKIQRGISFTEVEYRLAEHHNLTVLPFLLDSDLRTRIWKARVKKTGKADFKSQISLDKFYDSINKFSPRWDMREGRLGQLIGKALSDHLLSSNRKGWVKEIKESSKSVIDIAAKNEFVVNIVEKLGSFKKLDERLHEGKSKKEIMGEWFCQKYLGLVKSNNVNLFFESGSTIAYVARKVGEHLKDHKPSSKIITNNILVHLDFMLNHKIPCTFFPWSPPEEPYGASYGPISSISNQKPDYLQPPLNEEAKVAIASLPKEILSLTKVKGPTIILGTTSGIQLTDDYNFEIDSDKNDQTGQLIEKNKIKGPHAGSYYNKVFKRYLFDTGLPIINFVHEDKIDAPIKPGHCHFLFDSEKKWPEVFKDYPISFFVGCDKENLGRRVKLFEKMGMEIIEFGNAGRYTAFFASNDKFDDVIQRIDEAAGDYLRHETRVSRSTSFEISNESKNTRINATGINISRVGISVRSRKQIPFANYLVFSSNKFPTFSFYPKLVWSKKDSGEFLYGFEMYRDKDYSEKGVREGGKVLNAYLK